MLQLINLSKSFVNKGSESIAAVHEVNLQIKDGEFFSLLGPSGCGKTTLLRMLAGLESISSGQIILNGKRIENLSTQQRPFNMVFQRYALFPHLSVFDNVAFGLRIKRVAESEIGPRVREALHLVSMEKMADRGPETLSGGQAQRVAIARALVNEPEVLLLDEPLSALDQQLREHMQTELKALQRKLGLTFIYVTHDQEEALALSDRIGVMNKGHLEQVDEPTNLYRNPKTLFVAQFIGTNVLIPAEIISHEGETLVAQVGAAIARSSGHPPAKAARQIWMSIRPDRIRLTRLDRPSESGVNELKGSIKGALFKGLHTDIELKLDCGTDVRVSVTNHDQVASFTDGDRVRMCFDASDSFCFSRDLT